MNVDEPTPDEAPETASVPPETQRRASRDLVILYWVMGIFVLLPMVVLLVKFLGQE